jgi:NAD(P)-dependent dehydrogenase (short-subunit alcohol dehydrogenase family)
VSSLQKSTNYPSTNVDGRVADVRDEAGFTSVLLELAPVHHVIFSSVDKIIRGPLSDLDLDDAKHLFGVKFWGSVVVGKALLKHYIVQPGGSLTLTSGTAGIKPGKGASVGGALNGAVLSLTRGLATELAEKRIRVNTVVPGLVRTGLWDKMGADEKRKEELAKSGENLPVGFVAGPEDIAEAYVYLVRADYATGSLVEIGESCFVLRCRTYDENPADDSRWRNVTAVKCQSRLIAYKLEIHPLEV